MRSARIPHRTIIGSLAALILVIWFVGAYRGTFFGDPVFDRFLSKHNGNVIAALKDLGRVQLDDKGHIVSIGLTRSIRRNRKPTLYHNNVVLEYVKRVPTITTLGIGATCNINDRGMDHVAEMTQLESLNLNGLTITDAGFRKLHSLRNLKLLSIYVTDVTAKGVAEFQAAVPGCEVRWGNSKPGNQ